MFSCGSLDGTEILTKETVNRTSWQFSLVRATEQVDMLTQFSIGLRFYQKNQSIELSGNSI